MREIDELNVAPTHGTRRWKRSDDRDVLNDGPIVPIAGVYSDDELFVEGNIMRLINSDKQLW